MPTLLPFIKKDMLKFKKQVRVTIKGKPTNRMKLVPYPRKTSDYPKLRITRLDSRPSVGVKSLTFKAVVKSEETAESYITFVQFFGVSYSKEKDDKHTVPVKVDDTLWYHEMPSIEKHKVSLKCSCYDFRYRMEKELYDKKSLIGNWRKYVRQTPPPPKGYPYANPEHVLMFCKHIWSLLNALKKAGRIKE